MELSVKNLTMSYSNKTALDDVSLNFKSGGLIGLIGPNGAGKSTLLKILSTMLKPSSGEIFLESQDVVNHPKIMRNILGYLPQHVPYYPQLSATEYLNYIAAIKGIAAQDGKMQISQLLKQFHLEDVGKRRLNDFSGGMIQRVGMAATLLGDPKVILVDEPTAGLDPLERATFRNIFSELAVERIVILSTHIISDIEAVASDLVFLKAGRLLFHGSPNDLVKKANGMVWEYVLPSGIFPDSSNMVSSLIQESDGIHVRVIAETAPTSSAKVIAPRLEDASIALLERQVKQK